ncbi:MAG: AAA family ATPase [Prevotellaceae bacterium]|nr:AAA family ATPase [Prevotellaceae bacterium]
MANFIEHIHITNFKSMRDLQVAGELWMEDENRIKRYIFRQTESENLGGCSLDVPFGKNIINVFAYNPRVDGVKSWMKEELSKFGLEYVLDKTGYSLKVQQRLHGDEVFQQPYTSIADTLQRIIFYKTAVASNRDSVLLFEEPEAHAFPPYIKTITQDIIGSASNQFFIATHSPIILNDFMEYADARKEAAIYLLSFRDGQTAIRRLPDREVDEAYRYGEDLFFNIEKFL